MSFIVTALPLLAAEADEDEEAEDDDEEDEALSEEDELLPHPAAARTKARGRRASERRML
jgi:hypothetical protein